MKKFAHVLLAASLALVAVHGAALAQCSIEGNITAALTTDPALPSWEYTLTVTWDTGSMYGMSHVDLLIDPLAEACLCPDLDPVFVFPVPAGTSDGEGGCTAQYGTELDCGGDPSIPGFETGTLLKWEPLPDETCEPDVTGTLVVVFYSDHAPYPIDADAVGLVTKFAAESCTGMVHGVFPALACDSVPSEDTNWGSLKGMYR